MSKISEMRDQAAQRGDVFFNNGRIRSIVALFGWDDDTWTHGWAMDRRNTRRRMLGEISMLQYDMLTNVSFEDGDSVISQAFEE